jgi:ATP-dependent RNA helicase RhlE
MAQIAWRSGAYWSVFRMSFSTLGLSPSVCLPLDKLGYKIPTPIQVEAIPAVLSGRDLLGRAQTGTGKTAAFGLPLIDRFLVRDPKPVQPRKPRAVVLVPTRELALQVHESLLKYGRSSNLRATAILGGVSINPQIQALQRGAHIVIATPGRLLDHMQQRTVDLSAVEVLVLDEGDRMLDMGFLPALRRIRQALPKNRQTLLFSATFSDEVVSLSADFTRDPARVDVSARQAVATTVAHTILPVAGARKGAALKHVLTQEPVGQALVFCKTKRGSNRVGESLEQAGVKTAVIHGNKSQGARNRALGDFKAGRVQVLVATDIAARGLDIVQLPLVVNYDLPLVPEDYVHRVGRTGRAGLTGRAISLVSSEDHGLLRDIQRLLPEPMQQMSVEGFALQPGERDIVSPRRQQGGGYRAGNRAGGGGQRPGGNRPGGGRPGGHSGPRSWSGGPSRSSRTRRTWA